MSDLAALRPWLQLQALYARQISELGRERPDLVLLAGLAARAEQLLLSETAAQALRPPGAAERLRVKAAAAAAAAQLEQARAALERLQVGARERARARERALRAAQAYRAKQAAVAAPRYLDLRR